MAHFNFVISQNDVVTYCTEASNQKSKHVYRKILFYKKKHWFKKYYGIVIHSSFLWVHFKCSKQFISCSWCNV